MKKISLIFVKDGEEFKHVISSEKTLIGRDSSCDIFLDDASVSRKHAVILYRFERVYIENVSPSGQVLKSGEPIEYAELDEKIELSIGPYVLFWQHEGEISTPSNQFASEDPIDSQSVDAPLIADVSDEQNIAAGELVPYGDEAVFGNISDQDVNANPDFIAKTPGDEPIFDNHHESHDEEVFGSNEATKVTERGASPKLRITKGEQEGREIKLDIGNAWVVGRSNKAHVQIDTKKISRQHFKIVKIGNKYRVQDMGSSSGTKLNGVTVADAPLQPFDAIQAGAVEFQFLLVDSSQENLPILNFSQTDHSPRALSDFSAEDHQKSTLVNIPVPYRPGENAYVGSSGLKTESDEVNEGFGHSASESEEEWDEDEKLTLMLKIKRQRKKLIREWNKLPQQKKVIYSSTLLIIVLVLALGTSSKKEAPLAKIKVPDATDTQGRNFAQNPDISQTFYALSLDKQNQIRKLYQEAEVASDKQRWQDAFDASSKILEAVDKYKRTKDIMLEAQAFLNKDLISKLSPGIDDAKSSQKANQERINILLDSGANYLRKGEWNAAEEAFVTILNLDPTNQEAEQGLLAARKKDPMALNEDNTDDTNVIAQDPEQEAKKLEEEYLNTFESRYNEANRYVLESRYDQAMPILEDLYGNLAVALDEYSAGRGPASVRDQYIETIRSLQSKTSESYNQIEQNLSVEYQTQIADAEQYLTNRQYVMARKAYDKILQQSPYFGVVQKLRNSLYKKIITEAKNLYRGALIYESIGNIAAATSNLEKSAELLTDVKELEAMEYLLKTESKLGYLQN